MTLRETFDQPVTWILGAYSLYETPSGYTVVTVARGKLNSTYFNPIGDFSLKIESESPICQHGVVTTFMAWLVQHLTGTICPVSRGRRQDLCPLGSLHSRRQPAGCGACCDGGLSKTGLMHRGATEYIVCLVSLGWAQS